MSIRNLSAVAVLLLLATGSPAAPEPAPAPAPTPAAAAIHPDFSGSWKLDAQASDDPAQVFGGRSGPDGRGGERDGGGRRGMGRGPEIDPDRGKVPGEGFDGADRPERERAEAMARETTREFGSLEIFHAGDEFDLTDGMQVSRMLRIGGEPTEVFTPRGAVRAAAAWEGGILTVTERDPQGQVRRTRQFSLNGDLSVLTVREIRHRPGKEGDLAMTMVYRRQSAAGRP